MVFNDNNKIRDDPLTFKKTTMGTPCVVWFKGGKTVNENRMVLHVSKKIRWVGSKLFNSFHKKFTCLFLVVAVRSCFWIGSMYMHPFFIDRQQHHVRRSRGFVTIGFFLRPIDPLCGWQVGAFYFSFFDRLFFEFSVTPRRGTHDPGWLGGWVSVGPPLPPPQWGLTKKPGWGGSSCPIVPFAIWILLV